MINNYDYQEDCDCADCRRKRFENSVRKDKNSRFYAELKAMDRAANEKATKAVVDMDKK